MVQSYYLDDEILGGEPDDVLADSACLTEHSKTIGLELFNQSMCEVVVTGGSAASREHVKRLFLSTYPQLQFPQTKDLVYLGGPLLSDSVLSTMEKAKSTAQVLMDRLKILPAHHAYHLLRIFIGSTKLLHVLRCSRAYDCISSLQEFDESVKHCFAAISNNDLTEPVWNQAVLPISMGGIGLRRATELALSAFLVRFTRVVD